MEFPLYIPILGESSGAELDLLLFRNGKRLGFEFKCSDAPYPDQIETGCGVD